MRSAHDRARLSSAPSRERASSPLPVRRLLILDANCASNSPLGPAWVTAGAVVVVGGDVVGLLTALAAVVGGEGPALGALALALASAGDWTVVVVARRSPTGLPMASTSG
jgi:hypothetical protein